MKNNMLDAFLNNEPKLEDKLYCRGFLLTDAPDCETRAPFLCHWTRRELGTVRIFVHPKLSLHIRGEFCLIGHAYDPVSMLRDECSILKSLSEAEEDYRSFHQLTGVFTLFRVTEREITLWGDPTGMQTNFYAVHAGNRYVSSHSTLLGELLGAQRDPYVEALARYRFFPLLGNSLPGDLTPYVGIRRLVPNHLVRLKASGAETERFYTPHRLELSREELTERCAELLRRNLQLIAEKWKRPAISLTGGCDSKTTLACAAGFYERFSYFSYISSDSERVDAEAAAEICKALGLPHRIYRIPETDRALPGTEQAARLLRWNMGDLCDCNANDVRKRVFFADTADFDIEVKSWASEVGRAYYSKRFHGRTDFGPEPTPRACTALYKFFLHNRRLVRRTDRVFAEYLEQFFVQDRENPIPWQEQFFWEHRMPSWNGLVITGEHRYSFDITIPYNNRLLLELLLSASAEDRIHDNIHAAIRQSMNPAIDQTGIAVQNLKHTDRRAKIESLYYSAMTKLHF